MRSDKLTANKDNTATENGYENELNLFFESEPEIKPMRRKKSFFGFGKPKNDSNDYSEIIEEEPTEASEESESSDDEIICSKEKVRTAPNFSLDEEKLFSEEETEKVIEEAEETEEEIPVDEDYRDVFEAETDNRTFSLEFSDEEAPAEEEKPEESEQALEFDSEEIEKTEEEPENEQDSLLKEIFGVQTPINLSSSNSNLSQDEMVIKIFGENNSGDSENKAENDDYIALDDNMSEGTKEFKGSIPSETDFAEAVSKMQNGDEIVVADEMISDSENPYIENFYDSDDDTVAIKEILPSEYTEEEQYDEFAENLRSKSFRSLCSAIWLFIVGVVAMYLESASYTSIFHPSFLAPTGALKSVFYLVDIQLVFIAAIILLPDVISGFKNLFAGHFDRNTIMDISLIVSVGHSICCMAFDIENAHVYGIIPITFAFFNAIADSLDTKRIYRSFRIFASKKEKYTVDVVQGECAETEAFREYLEGTPNVFSVRKAAFVDNFFKNAKESDSHDSSYVISVIISFFISLVFAAYHIWQGAETFDIITKFCVMILMTLPVCSVFTIIIPFSRISKILYKRESAVAGVNAADTYSKTDIVSFVDSEVIPPKFVKISTVRTFGTTRIDSAILYATRIFKKLGGPLSEVFKKTLSGAFSEISDDLDFLEITADGLCANIDGTEVYIGNKEYMSFYDFGYTKDDIDEEFETTKGRIMYMVIGSELAAKFYVRYFVSAKFNRISHELNAKGIGVAVQTCDPNLDSVLLRMMMKDPDAMVEIVKTTDAMKENPVLPHTESGIACTSSVMNTLKTFTACDSLIKLIKANKFMKFLSIAVGALVLIYMAITGRFENITPLFVLLYNLIWLIPTLGTALTERK